MNESLDENWAPLMQNFVVNFVVRMLSFEGFVKLPYPPLKQIYDLLNSSPRKNSWLSRVCWSFCYGVSWNINVGKDGPPRAWFRGKISC